MGVRGEWRIATGTSFASDPTLFNADHASVYVAFDEIVPPLFQRAFRFYSDGTEAGAVALQTENTNHTVDISSGNVSLLLRFRILLNLFAGSTHTTDDWQLYMSKNGGGYALVATDVIAFDSSNLTDGGATTQRIPETGGFWPGQVSEDLVVDDYALLGGAPSFGLGMTEFLFTLRVVAASAVSGDTYDFRVYRNSSALGTYDNTARITITGTFSPGARRVFVISE
jgi:hypothetical protein